MIGTSRRPSLIARRRSKPRNIQRRMLRSVAAGVKSQVRVRSASAWEKERERSRRSKLAILSARVRVSIF